MEWIHVPAPTLIASLGLCPQLNGDRYAQIMATLYGKVLRASVPEFKFLIIIAITLS
jgi:hypothetical protein